MRPRRSTKICSGRLTMISLISGSRSSASSGPRPMTSSKRISTRRSLSIAVISAAGGLARKWSSVSCRSRRRIPARLLMSMAAAWRLSSWAWISPFAAARVGRQERRRLRDADLLGASVQAEARTPSAARCGVRPARPARRRRRRSRGCPGRRGDRRALAGSGGRNARRASCRAAPRPRHGAAAGRASPPS